LLAIGGGAAGVLAFPPFGLWPVAFGSIAMLSVAVRGRRSRTGAWLGLCYGLAFFYPLLHWTGVYVGPAPWLILATAEAGYVAGLGAVLALVQRLPAWPVWVGAGWVLEELVRDRWPFGGFPWGRWAFSQSTSPLRWFAALGGAPLVTFVTATGGGLLAAGILSATRRSWVPAAVGAGLTVAVPLLGLVASVPLAPAPDHAGATATVALIQGNVPNAGLSFNERRRQVLDNHVNQTLALAAQVHAGTEARPDLVLWPENSSDIDPLDNADAYAQINRAADAVGVPILVGAILDGPGPNHVRNVGILWFPGSGPGATYTKRHPVPWGEYIPLRGLARLISSKVSLVGRDMVSGHGNGLISGGPMPIGDVICFEVAYDGLVRSSAAAGAALLVVQTNDATFGHTAEAYQQLAMSQLRAVEHARPVLQVSTTGVSAVIGPDGRIRARSGALFTADTIVETVPLRSTATLATRLAATPEWVLGAVAVAAAAWSVVRRRRRRGSETVPQRTEEMVSR
jgi:apolipoprotein N-acyltransferase